MTTDDLSWVPADVDLNRPNAARVYDYFLGGGCNFEIDREFAKKVIADLPDIRQAARLNRGFLRRAVRYAAQHGVRQFLDLGAGIPTAGPTHEIAAESQPDCRVVYVDNEAVAVAHSNLLLENLPNATMLQADVRDVQMVLHATETQELFDFEQPIAVMMVALLHFVLDSDNPKGIVSRYRDAVPSGSYLILSHATLEGWTEGDLEETREKYRQTPTPLVTRDRAEIMPLLEGFELVDPGLVFLPEWHPESTDDIGEHPETSHLLGAVARKIG